MFRRGRVVGVHSEAENARGQAPTRSGSEEEPPAQRRASSPKRRFLAIGSQGCAPPAPSYTLSYPSAAAIFSAARVAMAMIVICGFTPSELGTLAPSTT